MMLETPFYTHVTFKSVEVPGIEPATSWLVVRDADLSANVAV